MYEEDDELTKAQALKINESTDQLVWLVDSTAAAAETNVGEPKAAAKSAE